jgi:hypothetical protein
MRNVSDKFAEEIKIYIFCSIIFFPIIVSFMRKCEKNALKLDSLQIKNALWRMRIACWIPKATKTHSEYVILSAFP